MSKKIGVILVNYNGEKYIVDCINSLLQQSYKNMEILFWDNHSEDDSVKIVKQMYPQVHIIESRYNYGFAEANNRAVEQMLKRRVDYVLLLNVDTVADAFLIERLLERADNNTVTTAQIYMLRRKRKRWYAGGELQFDIGDARQFFTRSGKEDRKVTFITGCCMLIHKDVIRKYGLFDTGYYLYYEDTDLCMRWYLAGVELYYVPEAKIWHEVGGSSGGDGNLLQEYYKTRNRLYFVNKYKKHMGTSVWKVLLMLIKDKIRYRSQYDSGMTKAFCLGVMDYYRKKMGRAEYDSIYQSASQACKNRMIRNERDMLAFFPYKSTENIYIENMLSIWMQYFKVIPYDEQKRSFREIKKCKGIVLNWYESYLNIQQFFLLGWYKVLGIKIIWIFHDMLPRELEDSFWSRMNMQAMIFLSDTIILHSINSQQCLKEYQKGAIQKAVYIPHMNYCENYEYTEINYREQLGISDNDFVFLFFGFIKEYKNIELVIQLFNEWDIKDAKLLIVGRAQDEQYLEKLKRLSGKNTNIMIQDKYVINSKVYAYFNTCDVAVMPYHKESCINSGAMINAFSCGRTVIIPDIPMAKDMRQLCYMYRYVSKEEHRQALEEAMRKCYQAGRKRNHEMGARAKEYVIKRHSREQVVKYMEHELEILKSEKKK